jgi:hypothetical protein
VRKADRKYELLERKARQRATDADDPDDPEHGERIF